MDSILKIKAIIFDFDGVILESMDIKTRAFAFLFKDYPNHLQEILKLHKLHGGMSRFEKFDRIYRDILKEPLSQDQKAKLGKDFSNYVYEEILKCPFVEGAFEFLEKYSEKLPLFIVSGTPDEEIKSIIKERNLEKYFKEVLGSPLKKKALNLKILKEYNLNPKDVIFVGDSIDDYEGAKETGIRFVGRIKEANPFEKFKIEATIHNIFDLKKIIPFGKQNSSVLVIFTNDLPKKTQKWWRQFERVVGPKVLREKIKNMHISFTDIEELTNPGSIQEAHRLGDKLSQLALSDGRGLPKLITYLGYEIWWMHYEDLSYKFCLPYTQYRDLLLYLKDFNKIYLYQAPHLNLFQYFFKAYNCEYIIFNQPKGFRFRLRKLLPIPLGILVQVILSLPFLLWLRITRPKLMVWTSDRFDPPHHCDFRMRLIYEELEKRKIPFVEFIRSQEFLPTVLDHAWQRKRPVVYSGAIIAFLHSLASVFPKERKLIDLYLSKESDPKQRFWLGVATHYLCNTKGTIWSINAMKLILQWIGVKSSVIIVGSSRTFHEVLACKLAKIKTVGIQHGAVLQHCFVSDFMPSFDGKLSLTPDMYGLWSNWWKEYYIAHSRAYKPEQLYISGHMRPLEKKDVTINNSESKKGPITVLFVSEQLADPSEVMPYLLALLEAKNIFVYLKLRSYRDDSENWLKENQPNILKKVKILRGNIHKAIAQSDVVVGSHSTGVLEALLQQKPFVFFQTGKWGDYFEINSLGLQGSFFAENPRELVDYVRKSIDTPKETLKQLQNQFFGDPHQNGSKWVVDQVEKLL